jgi:hypothetical protein
MGAVSIRSQHANRPSDQRNETMLTSIVVTFIIVAMLGVSLRSERGNRALISHQPYNNRHSDASGARDDHFA